MFPDAFTGVSLHNTAELHVLETKFADVDFG